MGVKQFGFLREDDDYYFDHLAVNRVVSFIERFCKLDKAFAGQKFVLLPWQRQIITDVFGWKRRVDNTRRFRTLWIECPRKQGKTYFVAALLLYLLMADGEEGAEVYASACTREQSKLLYKSMQAMRRQSDFLSERLEVVNYVSEIRYSRTNSTMRALSGESTGVIGGNPSAVVCDEFFEWEGTGAEILYEAITSGWGPRKQPLLIHITTAGFGSKPTMAKKFHERAKLFEQGLEKDSGFYGVVYGADLSDDWESEDTWKKASPSYELVKQNLKREFEAAKADKSKENTFKRLYLNMWTQQQTRWLDLASWKKVLSPIKYEDFKGRDVILGLDTAEIYDLTAVSLIYPTAEDKWHLFIKLFMPAKQVEKRTLEDGIPYSSWARNGFLIPTDGVSNGVSVDYERIIKEIETIANENNVLAVGYDPAGGTRIIPYLEEKGICCLSVSPKAKEMSPASKEFERRITTGQITIEDNPCLTWQAGNVEIKTESDGQIRPVKPNSGGKYAGTAKLKIDGIVSSIIATQATTLMWEPGAKEEIKTKPKVFFI